VPKSGEVFTARKKFVLEGAPAKAGAVAAADNGFILYVNGKKVRSGDNWETPESIELTSQLRAGTNEIIFVARNAGDGPNPAALYFQAELRATNGSVMTIASDATWDGTGQEPDNAGNFKGAVEWKPAAVAANEGVWKSRVGLQLMTGLAESMVTERAPVRAALMKSDLLMRTLGRPNREQIVSTRPNDLTTLEAIDLANGQGLATMIEGSARRLLARDWKSPDDLIQWLYRAALSRPATKAELASAREIVGLRPASGGVQDLLWAVIMLPEFQLIR
jgi:hypothetical protein